MNGNHILLGMVVLTALLVTLGWRYSPLKKAPLSAWGWPGLAIILLAELLLFLQVRWVRVFFTPIVWTGYLLFADSLVYSVKGSSRLADSRRSFLLLACWSVPLWLIFEAYNLRLRNWTYVGLPQNPLLRGLGYTWSFATIWPAIFETADLVSALGLAGLGKTPAGFAIPIPQSRARNLALRTRGDFSSPAAPGNDRPDGFFPSRLSRDKRHSPVPVSVEEGARGWPGGGYAYRPSTGQLAALVLGLACLTFPLLAPSGLRGYLFGAVWVGFILLLDPINYSCGGRSLLRDFEQGETNRLIAFLYSGLVCGILWEFWNYWASAKWIYVFPMWQNWKVFEMPAPGYLGFPPFGVECWVMFEFLRGLRGKIYGA